MSKNIKENMRMMSHQIENIYDNNYKKKSKRNFRVEKRTNEIKIHKRGSKTDLCKQRKGISELEINQLILSNLRKRLAKDSEKFLSSKSQGTIPNK